MHVITAGEAEEGIINGGETGDDIQQTLLRGGMETLVIPDKF